ncbi:transposase [Pseudomonas frederiksbergensis]|uniref:Transposase n=1 Tax=Pseudomonas frederiksbergensis TaxID=104087 RepID=A0A0U1PQI7_9PSED|nr:transposase [Pseudomonas frederiksbergensis]
MWVYKSRPGSLPYLGCTTQATGNTGKPVDGELLQYLSPLGWEHINLTGDYVWRQNRRLEEEKFRPLRLPRKTLARMKGTFPS